MIDFTCKDCRHWESDGASDGVCNAHNMLFWNGTPFCQYFETKDGKRPRFCRVASSVDEMAKGIVVQFYACKGWIVAPIKQVFIEYEDAVAAAKAWLMEVEE